MIMPLYTVVASGAVIVSAVVDVETVRPDVFDVTAATVLNGIV